MGTMQQKESVNMKFYENKVRSNQENISNKLRKKIKKLKKLHLTTDS